MSDKLKEDFLKSLRTIIGLPVVLILWVICVVVMFVLLALVHIGSVIGWVISGKYIYKYNCWQMEETEDIQDAFILSLLLPYHFVAKIWEKE